jgi:glucose-6-phosphate dehydrogenase assembly protein OpcA
VCTLSLAAFSREPGSMQAAQDVLGAILGEHPGRMFLVNMEAQAKVASLESRIFVDGAVHAGYTPTYSEIIGLDVKGDALQHLPNLIRSLLRPDQPACVWWVDPPRFSNVWHATVRMADRVIVDSAVLDPWDLMQLVEYVKSDSMDSAIDDLAALGDLNWARIKPFQALCARFFDAPRVRDQLSRLKHIEVTYVEPKGAATAVGPAMLAHWTRDRLLKCAQRQRTQLTVQVSLTPRGPIDDVAPGEVAELTLKGEGLELAVTRLDGPRGYIVGEARQGAPDLTPQHQRLYSNSKAWLLSQELQIYTRDATFEKALVGAVDILRATRR